MQRIKKVVPISIAMPINLARRLRVLAAQKNQSRSKFVREVLKQAVASLNQHDAQTQGAQGHEAARD